MFFDQVHGFKVKWSYFVLKISWKSFRKSTNTLSEWFFNLFFNDFERSDPWIIGRPEASKSFENQFRKSINSLSEWFFNQFFNDLERSDPCFIGRTRPNNLKKIYFENLSTLYLNDFLINFLMILSEATHCLNSESYAFRGGKLCFWVRKAMLSDC